MAGDREIAQTGNPTDWAGQRWTDIFTSGSPKPEPSDPERGRGGKGPKPDYRILFQAFENYERLKNGQTVVHNPFGDAKKSADPASYRDPVRLLGETPEPYIEAAKRAGVGNDALFNRIREWWGGKDAAPDPSVQYPRSKDAARVMYPSNP